MFYRSVVEYARGGQTLRAASRGVYRPQKHEQGDEAKVLLMPDGEVWLAFEWEAARASAAADRRKQRWTNRLMAVLLLPFPALALPLAVALLRRGGPA
jgi:hypothetical protein